MKREPVGNEHDQDNWLGSMLRRSAGAPPDACLDAETLAAWADGGLDAKASAAVELHASNCSRCAAVLAAMERTAPAVSIAPAWTPARFVRWLVPITAAATAIAIWIAVSDRPMAPVEPAPAHDTTFSAESGPRSAEQAPAGPSRGTVKPEPPSANPAPRTENLEPRGELRADAPSVRQEESQLRDEFSRERVAPQEARSAPAAAPVAAAPGSAAQSAAAPPASPPPAAVGPAPPFVTGTLTGTLTEATESVAKRVAVSNESVSPANPQVRWRIRDAMFVERSTNGGKTWTRTATRPEPSATKTPAVGLVGVRAVDANRAVVQTSDNADFYTTNAGRSWTRVQENSAAPF